VVFNGNIDEIENCESFEYDLEERSAIAGGKKCFYYSRDECCCAHLSRAIIVVVKCSVRLGLTPQCRG
jgi:hypothetical protein